MTKTIALMASALLSALATACSGVTLYDSFAPRDASVQKVGKDIPFGTDPRQKLDVYRPTGGAVKAPVIVFVYGGSWASGRRQDYGFVATSLAARGYVTVVPDYRLVPQVRFPAFIQDGAQAVAWVQKNAKSYGADPAQIILIGHSAGAYNIAMLGLDATYLQAAGVPMSSVKAVIGLSGPYDFYPWDTPVSVAAFGQAPDPAQTQPITFARADAPPMLLLTGDADTTVKPRNTVALAAKLQKLGGVVQTKQYPGMSHAGMVLDISKSFRHRAPVLDDIMQFIDTRTVTSLAPKTDSPAQH
jgi:acetyl esterase/lipase